MQAHVTLAEFAQEWFANPQWWFASTPSDDAYLSDKYMHLLDSWDNGTTIASIILLDQLPRHVFRTDSGAAHVIAYFLQCALKVRSQVAHPEYLDDTMWTFYELPVRHTQDVALIHGVMERAWARIAANPESAILKRFILATYQRCPRVPPAQLPFINHYDPISSSKFAAPDYTYLFSESVTKSLPNVRDFKVPPESAASILSNVPSPLADTTFACRPILLSLSGGVDSMVASYALLASRKPFVAVHINYMNRVAAKAGHEEAFLRDWCRLLGVQLYVRRITEIQRETAMRHELRDLYESYTRDIRFATYKAVAATVGYPPNELPQVLLGHNADDAMENILTNIAYRQKHSNLRGMEGCTSESGITFWRPLLARSKEEIYAFAAVHGIPHLPNSTPAWSQRGKIRASVLPALRAWDPRIVSGLVALADTTAELQGILAAQVEEYISLLSPEKPSRIVLPPNTKLPKSPLFWRAFFQHPQCDPSSSRINPSMKALQSLSDRLTRMQNYPRKLEIPLHKALSLRITQPTPESPIVLTWKATATATPTTP